MLKKNISVAFLGFLLSACTVEPVYRSVPDAEWKQLTAEQKQLIVDHAFHDTMSK
jgi:hypothetical protein